MRISRASPAVALTVLEYTKTPNGFNSPPRGFNTFGIQANPETHPGWTYDQAHVTEQCDVMAGQLKGTGFRYCSLDSGWSLNNGDENGRIIYDPNLFDLPALADHLHSKDLELGVYLLPGAFCTDSNKTILGTNIQLGSTFSGNNDGFLRCDFDFTRSGVQDWHNSVIELLGQWGVDFVKLDFVTPGSPDNGGNLPPDNSGAVIAYHKAIAQSGRQMRLDISWKLERNTTYYDIWKANADSMRVDQDINNSGSATFIGWATVQREIKNYLDYIGLQVPKMELLSIYPDMDNMYVGNAASITGVTDQQRETIATHWICAASNLITGSDLTNIDELGLTLLTDQEALAIADFTAQFPMQPRNPADGQGNSKQLQAWIAGPNPNGTAVVVLANYGPDLGQGGFGTTLAGMQLVEISLANLGLSGSYHVRNVWKHADQGTTNDSLSASLDEGESVLLKLTPA